MYCIHNIPITKDCPDCHYFQMTGKENKPPFEVERLGDIKKYLSKELRNDSLVILYFKD